MNDTCIDPRTMAYFSSIPDVIFDIILIVFPLPMLWRINISWPQKIAILGIFLLAGWYVVECFIMVPSFSYSFQYRYHLNARHDRFSAELQCKRSV